MGRPLKDKDKSSENVIDLKSVVKDVLDSAKDHHYNDVEKVTYKVSSGSLNFDAKLGGGVGPGLIRMCGGSESGKAQPLWAKVFTENGPRNIGDIKVGDKIYGKNGKLTSVIGIFPQGKKDVYKISFSDDTYAFCCLNHLWKVSSYVDRKQKDLNFYVRSTQEIKDKIKYGFHNNFCIEFCDPVQFPQKKLDIDPYVMGVLLGDGSFRDNYCIQFTNIDDEIINEVKNRLKNKYVISRVCKTATYRIQKFDKKDTHINRYIKNYDLMEKYSNEKFIPNDYLFSSIEDRLDLLRGLMDTDGYIAKRGLGCAAVYYTTSNKLKEDICFLVRSLGGAARINLKKNPKFIYKNEIRTGKDCWVINISFTNGINPFNLKRKKDLFVTKVTKPYKYITKIEKYSHEECVCIMVDDKDHLYLTDDFIVTHNTSSTLTFLENFLKLNPENHYGVYIDAECRLNDSIKNRYNIKFVYKPEEFVPGTCFVLVTTSYNLSIKMMRELVMVNRGNQKRFFFAVDSVDCLVTDETAEVNPDEVNQISGLHKAKLTTDFLARFSAAMRSYGHIGVFISQVRSKPKLELYAKPDPNSGITSASGAHSLHHGSDWTFEFQPHNTNNTLIKEKIGGEEKVVGHICKVILRKTQNDTSGDTVEYPIRRNAQPGQFVWKEREIVDRLLAYGLLIKKASWYMVDDSIMKLLNEKGFTIEKQFQGEEFLVKILNENAELTSVLYKYIIEVLSALNSEY